MTRDAWLKEALKLRHDAQANLPSGYDLLYRRPDLDWSTHNFSCYFAFLYDNEIIDHKTHKFVVNRFLNRMDREFGGIDSVVLWHAYPRIGVDDRNQFDFYRDLPGGIPGLCDAVAQFHKRNVKVYIDYNPWDTGTRRETVTDEAALAEICGEIKADGIFLDTMTQAPTALRESVDGKRKGVLFEPEGSPALEQLPVCTGSWAQWLDTFPEPGILRLKWIEPRHMQHQIRRWDRGHTSEIETAYFNGSGMLIWENIFGTDNPWSVEDRKLWRHAAPILRSFAPELASKSWEPYSDTGAAGVYGNRWHGA